MVLLTLMLLLAAPKQPTDTPEASRSAVPALATESVQIDERATQSGAPVASTKNVSVASEPRINLSPHQGRIRSKAKYPAIVGGVALVGGFATFLVAKSYAADLRQGDVVITDEQRVHLVKDGEKYQTIGAVLICAGGVGLAIAAALYFLDPPPSTTFAVIPGANGATLTFGGPF